MTDKTKILPYKLIYFIGLSAMAVGLPLSSFLMGSSSFLLGANWLLEGNLKEKWQRFVGNKTALVLTSLFALHLLGLTWTRDFDYAMNDIKIKLPLLVLPFLFSTMPKLSESRFNLLQGIFIFAVFCGTIVSMGVHLGIVHTKKPQLDIRDISIFISHIRFSLMICLSIFLLAYYAYQKSIFFLKLLFIALIIWFAAFLVLLESLTGIMILSIVSTLVLLALIFTITSGTKKTIFGTIAIAFFLISGIYLLNLYREFSFVEKVDFKKLERTSSHGAEYTHDTISTVTENGYHLWLYNCWPELENGWKQRSKMDYSGKDLNGNQLRITLIRFITSKGLHKDADALNSLSDDEIRAIEGGVANTYYMNKWSLKGRLHQTLWEFGEYKRWGDVSGHSTTQRIAYWRGAVNIIKENWLIGVGTGDVKKSFDEYYEKTNSSLDKEHRLHSHNQYLTIAVAFGLFGLCWLLFTLLYPILKEKLWGSYFYMAFILIAMLSFINEDTLETQAGVVFFSFFNCLYLFLTPKSDKQ